MSNSKAIYTKYVSNLTSFVQKLPSSQIMFIFFQAHKLDEPIVVTLFGFYNDWYIVPGQDPNYCYAYEPSEIKYIVSNFQVRPSNGPIVMYNVNIKRAHKDQHSSQDIANIGNHVDFSIQKSKTDVFFSVHYTSYNDEGNDTLHLFTRNVAQQCNFLVNETKIGLKNFAIQTDCVDRKNVPINKLANVFYEKDEAKLVHNLCKISVGQRPSNNPVLIYGGADRGRVSTYKGLLIYGPEFIKFMAETFISPLVDKLGNAESIYQYYDKNSMLATNASKSMQYVIELSENRVVVFAISTHRALKSCWTFNNKSIASEKEKKCLKQWMTTCNAILATDFRTKK